jgi:hypothetical protein
MLALRAVCSVAPCRSGLIRNTAHTACDGPLNTRVWNDDYDGSAAGRRSR